MHKAKKIRFNKYFKTLHSNITSLFRPDFFTRNNACVYKGKG